MNFEYFLPEALNQSLQASVADWNGNQKLQRLWAKDASLWTSEDEAKWLGWLDIVERQQADIGSLKELARDVRSAGFKQCLLLGMGGSSLCPEVLALTYGSQPDMPALHIVDSTDPAQVAAARNAVNLNETVCIVASKSGSTLEPNILKAYFFAEMVQAVGAEQAGSHFIAITDPGSKMEQVALEDKFRHIYYGDASIGGRFSALSKFGMVPAAVMGLDIERFLASAAEGVGEARVTQVEQNSAAMLGLILGVAHNTGRDKITFFTSPEICDLGAWMEQLIAESTGKIGKGITPVDREAIGSPEVYGDDRLFAYVRLKSGENAALDAGVAALVKAGQPVVRFDIEDTYDLPEQFFTWEFAVAVAGSVIGINTFNQPDVEAAKIATRELTSEYEKTGRLAEPIPLVDSDGLKVFADEKYAAVLGQHPDAAGYIKAHLGQLRPHDYFAALAYIQMTGAHEQAIQGFRMRVRDSKRVATCLGFGPRFLHSTGQDYKGGPNTGVFLQITADHAMDVAIPGARYTFGVVIDAQAAGDLTVLEERGRRALRVHLGADVAAGLQRLSDLVTAALA